MLKVLSLLFLLFLIGCSLNRGDMQYKNHIAKAYETKKKIPISFEKKQLDQASKRRITNAINQEKIPFDRGVFIVQGPALDQESIESLEYFLRESLKTSSRFILEENFGQDQHTSLTVHLFKFSLPTCAANNDSAKPLGCSMEENLLQTLAYPDHFTNSPATTHIRSEKTSLSIDKMMRGEIDELKIEKANE